MTAACPGCIGAPDAIDMAQAPLPVQLSVPSMRCAACIASIERHLNKMPAVRQARVNLSQKRVEIQTDHPAQEMAEALGDIGYEAFPLDPKTLATDTDPEGRNLLLRLGIAGFAMMNVMLLSVAVWSGADGATRDLFHLISAAIALPAVLFSAQPFFRNALSALRVARLNMDVPISLAILLAAGMSLFETLEGGAHAYFDAALSLTFFLLIGRYLEHQTRAAARSAAKELSALEVHDAQRQTDTGYETVPIEALCVGDTVMVPTGVRVPVDGTLISGYAQTDRSFLTGESEPASHVASAALHAGEINLGAPFTLRATAVGHNTRLQQIARLVDTAENARNRYTSLADRAAQIYAPAVHLLALATFIGWMMTTQDVRQSLNIAIAVLIITCPCALGLAVPAVSTAAIARLYRLGFLVKSGTALERLAEVRTVVFDKTGTLTTPAFQFDLTDLSADQLSIAKALSGASAHPLSKALHRFLGDAPAAALQNVVERRAKGIAALAGDQKVALGNARWFGREQGGLCLSVDQDVFDLPHGQVLRPGVTDMMAGLSRSGLSLEILSGDTEQKTAHLAQMTGIAEYRAGISPEAKTARIVELEQQGMRTCMFGDGLNDTIALAQAHASIAPGTALDAARNAADVVVVQDHLQEVPRLFRVARKAVRLSRQNFGIALAYNAVAIPIAVLGFATPLMAALAMSLSSITVLLNAMRVGVVK